MVSLLSSRWDQVVPTCSSRQAITVNGTCTLLAKLATRPSDEFAKYTFNLLNFPKQLGCYMVKSLGQLVLVS